MVWLTALALTLSTVHFGMPLLYYLWIKRYLNKPWNLNLDDKYTPKVTVIVPTYNEASIIEERLENLVHQDYPRELLEVIIIDSGSADGTAEIVERWIKRHNVSNFKLLKENVRKGKSVALNKALNESSGDVIIIGDADAVWPKSSIKEAVKWLSDDSVGAVSCLKNPSLSGPMGIEKGYRERYNLLRLAESKAYSTPIFHGELAAFKRKLLEKVGGFPTDVGADDSYTASSIALLGYRAIIPDNITVIEKVPKKGYRMWRVRRAQHLIQHFLKIVRRRSPNRIFKFIVVMETYLHVLNPWILIASIALLLLGLAEGSLMSLTLLSLGGVLLLIKIFRVWTSQQMILVIAFLRNMVNKEIIWEKQYK